MIVVDANIFADHIVRSEPGLTPLLLRRQALVHPFVLGEIALGSIRDRQRWLTLLDLLPQPPVARPDIVRELIETRKLFGTGLGYVDVHLLASTLLLPGARLWTRDKRLRGAADELGVAASLA